MPGHRVEDINRPLALRVRAMGFKEATVPLVGGRRSMVVKLVRSTDQAELTFQQAEDAREKARDDEARQKAAELYRAALKLRPANAAAHVGLARLLLDLNQYEAALAEIDAARRARPAYAEASAVEGRINREAAFTDEAIKSFRRSIERRERGAEARGFGEFSTKDSMTNYHQFIRPLTSSRIPRGDAIAGRMKRAEVQRPVPPMKYLALAPNRPRSRPLIIDQLKRDAAEQEIIP